MRSGRGSSRNERGLTSARVSALLRAFRSETNRQFAAFELDAVELFQDERDSRFGDVDERFRRLQVNRADLAFRNRGHARDHADEIAGQNAVRPADVERETNHSGFVRNRARFFARAERLARSLRGAVARS